jgi:hypothetical protein
MVSPHFDCFGSSYLDRGRAEINIQTIITTTKLGGILMSRFLAIVILFLPVSVIAEIVKDTQSPFSFQGTSDWA